MLVAVAALPSGASESRTNAKEALCDDAWARYVPEFNRNDEELYTNAIPNSAAEKFLRENAPSFTCPDADIERTYHFRWWTYRKHIRETPDGYVITEFLPPVGWAGKHNTINCATGHHVMEGRWLRDGRYLDDYIRFMLRQGRVTGRGAYVFYPAAALLERRKVTGDRAIAAEVFNDLVRVHEAWKKGWTVPLYPEKMSFHIGLAADGLYTMNDNYEGMEYSIGGSGYRPYLNSAMYAEARALACFARERGDPRAAEFEREADTLAKGIVARLWNPERNFFTVVTTNRTRKAVRELIGYTPWMFGVPVPKSCDVAFRRLLETDGFLAPYGLTMPEQSDPGFQLAYKGHECLWNGPIWPYATSLALTGLLNRLHQGHDIPGVAPADFAMLLGRYASAQKRVLPDGRCVSWIDENQNPYSGDWISRSVILLQRMRFPRERGKDYNHSTFCDLVITGLAGLVPSDDGELTVDPLIPSEWRWFALTNVRYRGHDLAIYWDADGTVYGKGAGLRVLIDGRLAAKADRMERVSCRMTELERPMK